MTPDVPPKYDPEHPVFDKYRHYLRYAEDHELMHRLVSLSNVITFEAVEIVSPLKIPSAYIVNYHIRSIVGIDANQAPIYSQGPHRVKFSFPPKYPVEPVKAEAVTDLWHPNIKSEGTYKGRICANVKDFGLNYTLEQVVLRIGEILQYKNYLADFEPPYPEDPTVAKWVKEYAEPNGIVNRDQGIYVDDTDLLKKGASLDNPFDMIPDSPMPMHASNDQLHDPPPKIIIKKAGQETKPADEIKPRKIVIKDTDTDNPDQ